MCHASSGPLAGTTFAIARGFPIFSSTALYTGRTWVSILNTTERFGYQKLSTDASTRVGDCLHMAFFMFHRVACKLRLRPELRKLHTPAEAPVYRRLADRAHRSTYASIERETKVHRSPHASLKLKPKISHFLLWLRRKQDHKLAETTLRPTGLPGSYKQDAILEVAIFHILTCLHSTSTDLKWLESQSAQLKHLYSHLLKRRKAFAGSPSTSAEDATSLAQDLGFSVSQRQTSVLVHALDCISISCTSLKSTEELKPWIRSLCAPSITEACFELAHLTNIPACVSSDILLRTPLSIDEVALQLDLWQTFIEPIARANHERKTHIITMLENLVFYTAQHDPRKLEVFLFSTLSYLTSQKLGFAFKFITNEFLNSLIFSLALTFIKNGGSTSISPTPLIKAQKVLVEFLGNENLSQKGYVGITLLISHESRDKAARLLAISTARFPEHSESVHIANIYLSSTPEELLHNFNIAIVQHPNSATMWLMLIKRLHQLHLLTEARSHKLLGELLSRKSNIVISKDIVLVLLGPIDSINGIENFIEALQKSDLFVKFQNVVLNKYMALLYRYGEEKNIHKPYLDSIIRHSSNVECARHLYKRNQWKTLSIIGVMLNGEVNHRPGELYQLYCDELQGRVPDEACLSALLRASMKRVNGKPYMWGPLYAPQVAVHEFKQIVSSADSRGNTSKSTGNGGVDSAHYEKNNNSTTESSEDTGSISLVASNRLWQVYIHALSSAEYTAELAEIMRWWESIHFIPSHSTLLLLLRALPTEFAERHIKHAHSLPVTSMSWPWPSIEDIRR